MKVTIYGRLSCPYCSRAIQISEHLKSQRDDFNFTFVDMIKEGLSKEDVSKTINQPVHTVPQVLLDNQYIGGCTEYEQYCRQNSLI